MVEEYVEDRKRAATTTTTKWTTSVGVAKHKFVDQCKRLKKKAVETEVEGVAAAKGVAPKAWALSKHDHHRHNRPPIHLPLFDWDNWYHRHLLRYCWHGRCMIALVGHTRSNEIRGNTSVGGCDDDDDASGEYVKICPSLRSLDNQEWKRKMTMEYREKLVAKAEEAVVLPEARQERRKREIGGKVRTPKLAKFPKREIRPIPFQLELQQLVFRLHNRSWLLGGTGRIVSVDSMFFVHLHSLRIGP